MTRYYIEAYGHDNKQILGNLDGQDELNVQVPRQTSRFKALKYSNPKRPKYERVKYWLLVDESGSKIEHINNVYTPSAPA